VTRSRISRAGIAYSVATKRSTLKPWIVFCHGAWLHGGCWTEWRDELARDFNVLTFDVPGYGDSPLENDDLERRTPWQWSGYILSLLDEMDVEEAYLVGESTGGAAVLHAAATHPERVRACAVSSTPFLGDVLGPVTGKLPAPSKESGIAGLVAYMLPNLFLDDDDPEVVERIRAMMLECSPDVPFHDVSAWKPVDFSDVARSVRAPVLILAPGRSPFIPREHSFELETLLSDPWLMLFGHAGHYFTFARARTLASIVRHFFQERADSPGHRS
jgi:pimeloyl-ACP methyl ester carboxylesterase